MKLANKIGKNTKHHYKKNDERYKQSDKLKETQLWKSAFARPGETYESEENSKVWQKTERYMLTNLFTCLRRIDRNDRTFWFYVII